MANDRELEFVDLDTYGVDRAAVRHPPRGPLRAPPRRGRQAEVRHSGRSPRPIPTTCSPSTRSVPCSGGTSSPWWSRPRPDRPLPGQAFGGDLLAPVFGSAGPGRRCEPRRRRSTPWTPCSRSSAGRHRRPRSRSLDLPVGPSGTGIPGLFDGNRRGRSPVPTPPEPDELAVLARSLEDDRRGAARTPSASGRTLRRPTPPTWWPRPSPPTTTCIPRPTDRSTRTRPAFPAAGQGAGRRRPGLARGHEPGARGAQPHRPEHRPHPDQPEAGHRSRPHVGHGRGDGPAVRRPRHRGRRSVGVRRDPRDDRPAPQHDGHRHGQRRARGGGVEPHRRVRHGRPADDPRPQLHRGRGDPHPDQRLHRPGLQQRRRRRHGHGGVARDRGRRARTAASTTSRPSPRRRPSSAT